MSAICMICKGEHRSADWRVVFGDKDFAAMGGASVRLSPLQAEIAGVIANKGGGFASMREIMIGIHGPKWHDHDPEHIPHYVSKIRKKLRRIGVEIISAYRIGYAARPIDGCECARANSLSAVAIKRGLKPPRLPKPRAPSKWEDANRLKRVALLRARGMSCSEIGHATGETTNAIVGAIHRNRQRIQELMAHEARIAMGHR